MMANDRKNFDLMFREFIAPLPRPSLFACEI